MDLLRIPNVKFSRKMAHQSFLERFKWKLLRLNTPSGYVPFDSETVKTWRINWVQFLRENNIDPRLVLNFDQIWRIRYRGKILECFFLFDVVASIFLLLLVLRGTC